jgi:hypothetical protein
MRTATALITEIHSDKRFKATCPACMADLVLSDAVLFRLGTEPPGAALVGLNAIRERIEARKEALRESRP